MAPTVDDVPPTVDVLAHGSDRPRRRVPWWVVVAVTVTVAMASLIWVLDGAWRQRSFEEIDRELDASLTVVLAAERQVFAMVEYTGSRRLALDTPPDVRAGLQELVDEAIANAEDQAAQARERITRIRVLPWQGDVAAARDAALARL